MEFKCVDFIDTDRGFCNRWITAGNADLGLQCRPIPPSKLVAAASWIGDASKHRVIQAIKKKPIGLPQKLGTES